MKKLFLLACDLAGLLALCTFAVMASIAFSCTKLLMAGFLRSILTLSDQMLTNLQNWRFPNLKTLTRGSKTWVTLTLGLMTVGIAVERKKDGSRAASASIISSQTEAAHPVDSSSNEK